ncbi:MAG: THUMP domain-containing protein, partial [Paludibacteraceae bacterium]|nr:THUMP domain-containing protein [Paludibacteraceae bacterium]
MQLLAKTFKGLEDVLAQELTELGANDIQKERRAVSFT